MRYSLRNKQKISDTLSPELLKRIIESLDSFFAAKTVVSDEDCMFIDGDIKFKTLIIDDKGHSSNMIAFYVITITFDVYQLAFKEFIG